MHGFLSLRTLDGTMIADGDLSQVAAADRVTSQTVYSQRGQFRMTSYHLIQKGPVFRLIAPLVGKQPPDSHVRILDGEVPAFVKAEQSMYVGGPMWRIEIVSPNWPKPPAHTP